jgi:hypothetical protein
MSYTYFGGDGSQPGILSRLLFLWYSPQISLADQRIITAKDTLPLPAHMRAEAIYNHFVEEIKRQLTKSGNMTSSVLRDALHNMIFWRFWVGGFFRLLNDMFVLAGPVLVKYMIKAAASKDSRSLFLFAWLILCNYLLQESLIEHLTSIFT